MKIAVYAISKNESNFVKRFCDSCKEADYVVICDTGSDDDTVQKARECGALVYDIRVKPWRFDVARNVALGLVPADADVCISIDLDEIMTPGWRDVIEELWKPETTRMSYLYDWGQGKQFTTSKIHSRHGYIWMYACHEFIEADARFEENYVFTSHLLVEHHADPTKSRSNYMDLLSGQIKERPDCGRTRFYYARELNYNARWAEAEQAWNRCLEIIEKYTNHEQDFIRRYLARALEGQEKYSDAHCMLRQTVAFSPGIRESWLELADFCHKRHYWAECLYAAEQALQINHKEPVYTAEHDCWGYKPYDLAALASYYLEKYDQAAEYGRLALKEEPANQRLIKNMEFYLEKTDKAKYTLGGKLDETAAIQDGSSLIRLITA
jgi:glycosyltransferase involved in cell wall biosynthesis